ncbi:hypothetical protein SLA2020_170560 [Shorea laevis]
MTAKLSFLLRLDGWMDDAWRLIYGISSRERVIVHNDTRTKVILIKAMFYAKLWILLKTLCHASLRK